MPILPDESSGRDGLLMLFRILTRPEWEALQTWHALCPGSKVEHLYAGLYVLAIPPAGEEAA